MQRDSPDEAPRSRASRRCKAEPGALLSAHRGALHHCTHRKAESFDSSYYNYDKAMAPVRRYLRISKYSVLECRIYLDNPALAQSWLLNPRNPILPRVIESIRPLVLPKLREEKERSRKKSTKKKGIKDVIIQGLDSIRIRQVELI